MSAPRPTCVNCGSAYGQRAVKTDTVVWPGDQPMPPYLGNGLVVSVTSLNDRPQVSSGSVMGLPYKAGDRVAYRRVWDGETWYTPAKPFCTLKCALSYARKAYNKRGAA